MANKIKHLELIQGVINRLAANSFQMKGWAVVLVAAILVLLAREDRLDAAFIALAPIVVFWGLDAYFLWQERLYRSLYDHVRALDEVAIDFSMDVRLHTASRSWCGAVLSLTLIAFYAGLTFAATLASITVGADMCLASPATAH